MIFIYLILAAGLVYLSFRSYRNGLAFERYIDKWITDPRPYPSWDMVSVIVPCRGNEPGLPDNLRSLLSQKAVRHEIIFVTDDPNDDAVPVIRSLIKDRSDSKLIFAAKASHCSQKIENVQAAVRHVNPDSSVLVFADSDVRFPDTWLADLTSPLVNPRVGATTGYRWFYAERPTFATELLSAWNASIASALGPNLSSNFCWGGSMAIRRDTSERLNITGAWNGAVSDDLVLTRMMQRAGLDIVYVPTALLPSLTESSLGSVLEFTTRQIKITRVYAPQLWARSFVGSLLFVSVMLASAYMLFSDMGLLARSSAVITLTSVGSLSTAKAYIRWRAVMKVLPQSIIKQQFWPQITLWLAAPALFLWNTATALFSRRISWRGIRYELKSPTETVIIRD
jgi:ceramide glucosyltransferase